MRIYCFYQDLYLHQYYIHHIAILFLFIQLFNRIKIAKNTENYLI